VRNFRKEIEVYKESNFFKFKTDYLKVHLDISNYEQFQWLRTFIFQGIVITIANGGWKIQTIILPFSNPPFCVACMWCFNPFNFNIQIHA